MRIDPNSLYPTGMQPDQVSTSRTENEGKSSQTGGFSRADSGATVNLSSAHAQVQAAKAAISKMDDVRSDRVAQLQAQIANGSYNPSNGDIAGAMMTQVFGKP